MIIDKKEILNVILSNYDRDYTNDRFSDDYELISAYKKILDILLDLKVIDDKFKSEIKWAIDEKQHHFDEFY